ncbi:hypothetical protein NWP21_05960 [Anabaenopsis sp. FSS-46]|uniref:hypothetical protein n=1 Tax=Anabaenopsis sp. FSS-46 TaxID=2971766 RepID=UPI00247664A7|nr:hypothetical protein [Anabaenopsis sp. FSS-46]MDH6098393.1 hypothetical protein [Anabaenopsis sp. FSS-46]
MTQLVDFANLEKATAKTEAPASVASEARDSEASEATASTEAPASVASEASEATASTVTPASVA